MNHKEIQDKMIASIKTRFTYRYDRDKVRCPSLKRMAEYVNLFVKGYSARVRDASDQKGYQMSSGVWTSRRQYDGNEIVVTKSRTGEVEFKHNAVETYRHNTEVAEKILRLEGVEV